MNTYLQSRKPVILCADDYGIAPGVSRGIRQLAAAGRLSATSCMTVFPEWPEEADRLGDLVDRIDIGLHLTLTDQRPLGAMPKLAPDGRLPTLGRLIGLAHLGHLDRLEIADEIARQFDAFEAALGRPPAFIDGHQHVHLLPGIRESVLALFDRRLDRRTAWLRSCAEPAASILRRRNDARRALVIAGLARPLHRATGRSGIATNLGFSGVTSFRADRDVEADMADYLSHTGARPLIMCHPGEPDDILAARDPILGARAAELSYFGSARFAEALDRHGVVLAPGPRADDETAARIAPS